MDLHAGAKSTDDTEFAVLTAQTLIDCGGNISLEKVGASWKRYILDEGGARERGGFPLYGAVANLERGIMPPRSGTENVFNDDDGAAMRIAPVGILCAGNPKRAVELAEIDASVSHARDGIWGAQAVAAGVAVAMTGAPLGEVIDAGISCIPDRSWLANAMGRAMEIVDNAASIEDAWDPLHDQLWTAQHAACAEALPQAFAMLRLTEGDFRQGMIWAGNFGRDADTIGAIVGAIAGAMGGEPAIPTHWIDKIDSPAGVCLRFAAQRSMRQLADDLVALHRAEQ